MRNYMIIKQLRAAEESDIVIVILEVTDVARAKEYWHSVVLAQGRMVLVPSDWCRPAPGSKRAASIRSG